MIDLPPYTVSVPGAMCVAGMGEEMVMLNCPFEDCRSNIEKQPTHAFVALKIFSARIAERLGSGDGIAAPGAAPSI